MKKANLRIESKKDFKGNNIISYYDSKNQLVKREFTVKEEINFLETSDQSGRYSSKRSKEYNTYIAEQKSIKWGNKRRTAFSLYLSRNKKEKPVLISRTTNKKKLNQGFETNLGQSTGFRSYYKRRYDKAKQFEGSKGELFIITTDRPRNIKSQKDRGDGVYQRYKQNPQMVAKVLVSDSEDKTPQNVFIGYSSTLPNTGRLEVINQGQEECKNYAIRKYMEYYNLYEPKNIKYDSMIKKHREYSRFEAQVIASRWQYWSYKKHGKKK